MAHEATSLGGGQRVLENPPNSSCDRLAIVLFVVKLQLSIYMWQTQVENEHYSTVSGLIRLVISLECFIEITPDFLCPFMND